MSKYTKTFFVWFIALAAIAFGIFFILGIQVSQENIVVEIPIK